MTRLVVEFGNPEARRRAQEWRKELIESIDAAILGIVKEIPNKTKIQIFQQKDFSVYLTFEERAK